jgi:hypothetical protein
VLETLTHVAHNGDENKNGAAGPELTVLESV